VERHISYGLYVDDLDADVNALLLRLGATRRRHPGADGIASWMVARDILEALDRRRTVCNAIAGGSLDEAVEEPTAATRSDVWRNAGDVAADGHHGAEA